MPIDARPTVTEPDDDPYLWLEEIESTRALAWVTAQNDRTLATFGGIGFVRDRDTLATLLDRPDHIPFVARRGQRLYNFWKDAANPRGLWRRTTLASFRSQQPVWEHLLDLDMLAKQENEDWIWHGATTLPGTHDRAVLSLSRGGSDATVLREFDIEGRGFVSGGFYQPEAKGSAAWLNRDTLLLSSAFGEGMATNSGYARTVRLWQRGSSIEQAPVLMETSSQSMGLWALVDRSRQVETVWFADKPGFFDTILWLGDRSGPKVKLDLPTDVFLESHGDWMVVKRRTQWTVGGTTYAPDTLLGIALSAFLSGARNFTVLFEPSERRALQGFFWTNGPLVLAILDELRPVFEVLTPSSESWFRTQLSGLPEVGMVNVWRFDMEEAESNGDLLANAQDPITPATLALIEPSKAPAVLKRAPATFNAHGLVVTRHEAVALDGERIPYVQVGPPGETGAAPVLMNGYGGFGLARLPYYSSAVGKLWLERGGTSVTANIRGGGEFGSRWHDAGRLERKPVSHDDFAAVAADLVKRGITRPARIAAEGASNGGILITNMLTRYPDRFGALFCTIPLIDMRRYTKLLAGASWIAEYGDPDRPEEWAYLQKYSAYHQARPGCRYPPILLATTRKDDRVHPGHARKMAAKLQAIGYEIYFYEPAAGGHGYGKDNKEVAAFVALGYAFLREKIGWSKADETARPIEAPD
jgi:prolyl oligopeptidase